MISFLRGIALAAFLQGCAIRPATDVQYPEQQEVVSPTATLDELLSGSVLEQQQKEAQQLFPEKAKSLKQKIVDVIRTAYLVPLNTPDPKNRATCVIPEFTQQNADNFCLTQCVGRTDEWDFRGSGFRFFLKSTVSGLEERMEYSSRSDNSQARFYYVKNDTQTVLQIDSIDVSTTFQREASLYNDTLPSYYYRHEVLTLTQTGDKFTLDVPFEKYLKPGAKEAITAEFSDLIRLFKIAELAKRKYGVDVWLQDHQAEIKAKQAQVGTEIAEARARLEEQQRLEEQRRSEVEELQRRRREEWQRQQTEAQRQERLRQEQRERLSALEQKFERSIEASSSYAALLKDPANALLFEAYPHLRDPLFNVDKIKTSVTDPRDLNDLLGKLKQAVGKLPSNYKELAPKLGLYLYTDEAQLKQLCKSQRSAACYLNDSNIIALQANDGYSLPHELAHAWMDHLPTRKRQQLVGKLSPHIENKEVKTDVVRDAERLGKTWRDGSEEPRYSCVRPYGCSNVNEYVATHAEDVLQQGGRIEVQLLQGKFNQRTLDVLETLKEFGFFGTLKEADELLEPIYQQAR